MSSAAEKSDADRDAELGALTDAIAELRAQTALAEDLETLARCARTDLAIHPRQMTVHSDTDHCNTY